MSDQDLLKAMNEQLANTHMAEYLKFADETGLWELDDEPNCFNHPTDGLTLWLKSAKSRLRISEVDARLFVYGKPKQTWNYNYPKDWQSFKAELKRIKERRKERSAT